MIQPMFSRILVKRDEVRSNLFIPEGTRSLQATAGTVISVGNECTDIEPGDRIYWGKYSGAEIEFEGIKYIVMNEEDVIGRISEEVAYA